MGENNKLKWINHSQSILSELRSFRNKELFSDCTILCGGKHFPVHRLVLSSCSDYFKQLFSKTQCCHPFIIMNDIYHEDLEILLNYIYEGNSVVLLEKLSVVIKEGQSLKIKGFEHPTQLVSTSAKAQSPPENSDVESDYETLSQEPNVLLQKVNGHNIKKRKEDFELKASEKKIKPSSTKRTDILSANKNGQEGSMTEQHIKLKDSIIKHDTSEEVSTTEGDVDDFKSMLHDSEVNPSILPDLISSDIEVKEEEIEMFNSDLDGVYSSLENQENIEDNQSMGGAVESLPSTSQQCLDVSNSGTRKHTISSKETDLKVILPKIVIKSTSSSDIEDKSLDCHPSSHGLKKKNNSTSLTTSMNDDDSRPKQISRDKAYQNVAHWSEPCPSTSKIYHNLQTVQALESKQSNLEEINNPNINEASSIPRQAETQMASVSFPTDSTCFYHYCHPSKELTQITPDELSIPRETLQIDYPTSDASPHSGYGRTPEELDIPEECSNIVCTNTILGDQQTTSKISTVDPKNPKELGILEQSSHIGCTSGEQRKTSDFPATIDYNNPDELDIPQQSYDVECSGKTSNAQLMITDCNLTPTIDLDQNVEIFITGITDQENLNNEAPQYLVPAAALERQTDMRKNKMIKISTQKSSEKLIEHTQKRCGKKLFINKNEPSPLKPKCFVPNSSKCSPFKMVLTKNTETEVEQRKKRFRRSRPCLFCGKFLRDLTEHLSTVHKNKQPVADALKLPKKQRREAFDVLRKKGIELVNHERLATGEKLLTEHVQKGTKISQCKNCSGFYALRGIWQHKSRCNKTTGMVRNEGIRKCFALSNKIENEVSKTFDKDFQDDILGHLHQDDTYQTILNSNDIQICGNDLFGKLRTAKREEGSLRERVRSHMRRLANILQKFNNLPEFRNVKIFTLSEIFNITNYTNFKKLIIDMIYKTNPVNVKGKRFLKEGTALKYQYSILDAIHALISFYAVTPDHNSELVESLKIFDFHYRKNKALIFGGVGQFTVQRRAESRKFDKLPCNKDIELIISKSSQIIDDLGNHFSMKSETNFVLLRRAVCTRLIFFNSTKPREVSTLSIKHWELAKENACISRDHLEKESEKELNVLASFRIMFITRKTSEVSVLVPRKLFMALDLLCDPEFREIACIPKENKYLFPSTKRSLRPTSGSADVQHFVRSCDLNLQIKSVQVRHTISTKFGWADHSEESRKSLKRYLEHSQSINEDIGQLPQALMVIKKIGTALAKIEKNCGFLQDTPEKADDWEDCDETIKTPQNSSKTKIENIGSTSKSNPTEIDSPINDNLENISAGSESENPPHFTPNKKSLPRITWGKSVEKMMSETFSAFLSCKEGYPERTEIAQFLDSTKILQSLPLKERKNAIRRKLNNMKRLQRHRTTKKKK